MSLENPSMIAAGADRRADGALAADEAIVAMGANLPSDGRAPQETLVRAIAALGEFWTVAARSGLWRTPAWPDPDDPPFVNACVRLSGVAEPSAEVLARLHAVEERFGRVRGEANAPRTLDLDLVDHGGRVAREGELRLPHPRAAQRAFVLLPLRDVAPRWREPGSEAAIGDLLARLPASAFAGIVRLVSLHCEKPR
jgi:2-amino-4-hydroxy-6-hydroxymethyldihydropteridine diphosphokinase